MLKMEDYLMIKTLKRRGIYQKDIAEELGVDHVTVMLWVKAHADRLPEQAGVIEMDELFTFVGRKKRHLCHDPSRPPHQLYCDLGSGTGAQRSGLTSIGGWCPQARFYYSDLFATYRPLLYTPSR